MKKKLRKIEKEKFENSTTRIAITASNDNKISPKLYVLYSLIFKITGAKDQ